MYPLFESIKIVNGKLQSIEWHERRIFLSCVKYFGEKPKFSLSNTINPPAEFYRGVVKLKLFYNNKCYITHFSKYTPRKITTLKIVISNNIEYSMKYTNRVPLLKLLNLKGKHDDILIVKNGFITDSSFANIVFYDGKRWLTPSTPLLKGTCRERLLRSGKILESPITIKDLSNFVSFKLINAFRDLNETEESDIENIHIPFSYN